MSPEESIEQALNDLNLPEEPARLYDPIRHTLRTGGKRMRPKFVLLGCELCGGDPNKAIPAALSVELIHNFTLIHDDIMDDAATRRGQPTVYNQWGTNDAILSGDYLFALAFDQIGRYKDEENIDKYQFGRLYETLLSGVRTVCEGQSRDMAFESAESITLEDYLQMIGQKTAALLQTSVELGAIVGGGDPASIKKAGQIAYDAGIAFQIQDDMLDAVGDAEKFGKKIGGDVREQKKTCLYVMALEKESEQGQQKLRQWYASSGGVSEEDVKHIIDKFRSTGALDASEQLMSSYYQQAVERLEEFDRKNAVEKIKTLLEQLRVREK